MKTFNLKQTKRTGWINVGLESEFVESVAEHSFGTALLALLVEIPNNIDREKLVQLALLHDIGESIIGDIVWETADQQDLVLKRQKDKKELKAVNSLFALLGETSNQLHDDLLRYLSKDNSPEIQFLKQLDVLEMAFQASIYSQKFPEYNFVQFYKTASRYVVEPSLLEVLNLLKK